MKLPGGLYVDNPAWPLLQAHISYQGITTAAGNVLGTTLVDALCSTAGQQPSYVGLAIKILDGPSAGQVRVIAIHTLATGTITVAQPWTNPAGAVQQIAASTRFVILSISGGGGAPAPPLAPSIGLWMFGVCDPGMAASLNTLVMPNLAGFPNDIFNTEFWVQVIHNFNNPGVAPEREIRRITDYVGATGTFTTDAFTVNVEANDLVAVFHESIMGIEILGFGTLTLSSATVPEDNLRPEVNDYFNGCLLMPTEGACRFQPRRILDWTLGTGVPGTGVFTLDPNNPLTGLPGIVDYVIIGDQTEFVPAASGANNRTPSDVIGNKTSTPIYTPDNVSDIIRYLKGILLTANLAAEPTNKLIEPWQDLIIDPNIWTVVNPATGLPWTPQVSGAFLYNIVTPNANEVARLRGNHWWVQNWITPNTNLIVKKLIMEFELMLGVPANLDNTQCLFGLLPSAVATRATNNIIGFALLADVLQTVTDSAGAETVNTGFAETLTNHNKFRIEVIESAVRFYLNEVLIATHAANVPTVPMLPTWYIDTDAGGACAVSQGIIRIWHEMVERY